VRSEVEWAQVRALAADGVSKRQIAKRLGINRRTVDRLIESPTPPTLRASAEGFHA
jgi:DNA invertase Pin-like site-specific DNA recombinase